MLAQGRRRVALLAPGAGYAWKAWQRAERCACFAQRPAGDAHTTCLRMWIVQRLVDGVERPKAAIDTGHLPGPHLPGLRLDATHPHPYARPAPSRSTPTVHTQASNTAHTP